MCRIDKDNYYLDIAETVAERSTCLKRKYGAIIVNNDSIISTGFNGASRGIQDCLQNGFCNRHNAERGMDYSNCLAVHAEQNAIIHASRNEMLGGIMYLVGYEDKDNFRVFVENAEPCSLCKRMIINSGIEKVIVREYKLDDKYRFKEYIVKLWKKDDLIGGY